MLKKIGILGVLGAAVLGLAPDAAHADSATVQTGTQQAVVTGNNNQVIQVINQVNIEHPGRGREQRQSNRGSNALGNTAVIQDAAQGAVIDGNGNTVYQETTQENRTQSHPGRGYGRGGRREHDNNNDDGRHHSRNRGGDDDHEDDD